MANISELFGVNVFNDEVMQNMLAPETYEAFRNAVSQNEPLTLEVANKIAKAMKDWALSKGATHYTHWFQPMTGITAEKHDSFLTKKRNGNVITDFKGRELIKGEPDASSFPSGGIRATFEARGYTDWDPTSYAFIKDGTLYIPTAFCSYTGEALDKKTPLLRSMEALNKQAVRLLKLIGKEVKKITPTVGAEQEYFLIDKEVAARRADITYTGRTLFGAKPPKGQELDDQYFATIKPRVLAFMQELDEELWKLGVVSKTRHNEVAPSQHELAPVFDSCNVSTDHNQLTMELMKKLADKHGMVCLLHEKPFAGVNGSGKHNNWSLSTENGENLLDPGENPQDNLPFLVVLAAVIKAVDEYQDILRVSVSSAGNDHRLGANEAPPAIVSMYIGDDLEKVVEAVISGGEYSGRKTEMEFGAASLPKFNKDNSDRNRTSPFAFTGNKFEFRMPGSSCSIAGPNIMLNTAVAEAFDEFASKLEKAEDVKKAAVKLIAETIEKHGRIIFNGNGYSEEWVKEAERRGLMNLKNTVEALPHLVDDKNVRLFAKYGVYTESELKARHDILLEGYSKTVRIEALTMAEIARKDIFPSVNNFVADMCGNIAVKHEVLPAVDTTIEEDIAARLSALNSEMMARVSELDAYLKDAEKISDVLVAARYYRDNVVTTMEKIRAAADEMETSCDSSYWPMPAYGELLFSVK
ncbi:MAG: glutamine synthetase III [Clostridia bacterium]|nr:glutamine synthetase III [Clostridia bacterium]